MNVLENFKNLFLEIWQTGIAGVNFTQIGLAIAIFFVYLIILNVGVRCQVIELLEQ